MAKRGKISQLPPELKAWLDKALVDGDFSGYALLAAELRALGQDISKSSLHRYGQDFQEKLTSLRLVTEQARAVVQAAPDDDNAVNEALVRMTQEKMFSILMQMNPDPASVDFPKFARAIADMGKVSLTQKRWAAEARKQALQDAAKEAGAAAKSVGMSDANVAAIKTRILGIDQCTP